MLFYQALAIFAEGLGLWVVLGVVTAAVALAAVAYAVLRLGKRLPFKPMLIAGATILLLLSVAFAGNAVRSLQEADWIRSRRSTASGRGCRSFVAELTGIHPTREGIVVQAALLGVYVAGAACVFGWKPCGRRGREAARA